MKFSAKIVRRGKATHIWRWSAALALFIFTQASAFCEDTAPFEMRRVSVSSASDTKVMQYERNGKSVELNVGGDIVLALQDIKDVRCIYGRRGFDVLLDLSDQGASRLANYASKHQGEKAAVLVQGKVVSAPSFPNEPIQLRSLAIGPFNEVKMREIYRVIKAGLDTRR